MNALVLLVLSTFHMPPVVAGFPLDTGMGRCGMDEHMHVGEDFCRRNSDDSALHVIEVPNDSNVQI